jgi:hypothetical protein
MIVRWIKTLKHRKEIDMKISGIMKIGAALSATTLACLATCLAIRGHRKIARCKAKCDAEVARHAEACDEWVARHKAVCDRRCKEIEEFFDSLSDDEIDYIAENLSDEELLSLIIQIMSELDNASSKDSAI